MKKLLHILSGLCIVLIVAVSLYITTFNDHCVVATVVDKTVKIEKDSSYYLIFTDCGVFKNADEVLRWKFNSSDFYAKIRVGTTYKFTLVGYRIPFFSLYENIIKAERVEND